MNRIYYDTPIFWRFFEKVFIKKIEIPDDIEYLSPTKIDEKITRITAPWTLDEFFHNYIKEKRREIKSRFQKKDKLINEIEDLAKTKGFMAFFKQESIDTRALNNLFLTLFEIAKDNDILALKKKDKRLNSKDLLHFAYALLSTCSIFVTCDNDFKLVQNVDKIKKIIRYYKMKKVIILNDSISKVQNELNFEL